MNALDMLNFDLNLSHAWDMKDINVRLITSFWKKRREKEIGGPNERPPNIIAQSVKKGDY